MKKVTLFCLALLLFGTASTRAQGLLDKLDKVANKVDRATNKVERAGNTADRASKTGGKIASLFGKGKDKEASGKVIKSSISIENISLADLKKLNNQIEQIEGVESSTMKFNASASSITVKHAGSTDDLLETLQKQSAAIFSDQNIQEIEDGVIKLSLQK